MVKMEMQTITGTETGSGDEGNSISLEQRLQQSHPYHPKTSEMRFYKDTKGNNFVESENAEGGYAVSNLNGELSPLRYMEQMRKRIDDLEKMAYIDEKTQVWASRYLEESLDKHVRTTRRNSERHDVEENKSLTLAMCDLDNFKKVNDTYGHHVGDAILYCVSQIIDHYSRGYDVVRFGGEEIAVIASETSVEESRIMGERLRTTVEALFSRYSLGTIVDAVNQKARKSEKKEFNLHNDYRDEHIPITLSIGAANYTNDVKDPYSRDESGRAVFERTPDEIRMELFDKADKALYHSKEHGRNRLTVYSLDMNS